MHQDVPANIQRKSYITCCYSSSWCLRFISSLNSILSLNEEKLAGIIKFPTPHQPAPGIQIVGKAQRDASRRNSWGLRQWVRAKEFSFSSLLVFSLLLTSRCTPPLSREIVEKLINGMYKQRRSNSPAFVKLYLRQHVQTIIIFFAVTYTITLKESLSLLVIVSTNAVCRSRLCQQTIPSGARKEI